MVTSKSEIFYKMQKKGPIGYMDRLRIIQCDSVLLYVTLPPKRDKLCKFFIFLVTQRRFSGPQSLFIEDFSKKHFHIIP